MTEIIKVKISKNRREEEANNKKMTYEFENAWSMVGKTQRTSLLEGTETVSASRAKKRVRGPPMVLRGRKGGEGEANTIQKGTLG